jgi:3-dehydroquinate synthetase/shikimate kinase
MTGGRNRCLVFIGFMGAGKTTGARAAAAALGVKAMDTDRALEQRLGASIDEYFASHGERAFREAEEDLVAEFLEAPPAPVLSLGGGAIGSPRVRELLQRHTVVLLHVDEATAWRRAGGKRRPLARDRERFAALHAERGPVYESLADAILLDGGADTIRAASSTLRAIPPGVKVIWAVAGSAQYPVFVGDVLDGTFWPVRGRRFVISDETVAGLHGDRVPDATARLAMPPGEEAKTLANAERLLRALADAGMDHDDHVVALGGGVVGDVGGFCAAVYQRGVGVVQVPTSLVAQVDSAYGGKTGVDIPEGKNYAGAYHLPAAVIADTSTLATLPHSELAAGFVEALKTGLLAGGKLWERVRAIEAIDPAGLADVVFACARYKCGVVAADERDAGLRQALNLGHTVGHGIEAASGYGRYRHGEAIGLGLLAALRLSDAPALRDECEAILDRHGLPLRLDPAIAVEDVLAALERDKKRTAAGVGFVLLSEPGEPKVGQLVDPGRVREAVEELYR